MRIFQTFTLSITLVAVISALSVASAPARAAQGRAPSLADKGHKACVVVLRAAERRHKLPDGLLLAVALARTYGPREPAGGLDPWQVRRQGDLVRFVGREELEATIGIWTWQAQQPTGGVSPNALKREASGPATEPRLEVGCGLLQWWRHRMYSKVGTVEKVVDPRVTADYLAGFLRRLYKKHRSWTSAVAYSYSKTDHRAGARHACNAAIQLARLRNLDVSATGSWRSGECN